MMQLRHKNLVNFFGVVVDGNPMYIISELCKNGNLKHFLKTPEGVQDGFQMKSKWHLYNIQMMFKRCPMMFVPV